MEFLQNIARSLRSARTVKLPEGRSAWLSGVVGTPRSSRVFRPGRPTCIMYNESFHHCQNRPALVEGRPFRPPAITPFVLKIPLDVFPKWCLTVCAWFIPDPSSAFYVLLPMVIANQHRYSVTHREIKKNKQKKPTTTKTDWRWL